jgi:hypothetical protein
VRILFEQAFQSLNAFKAVFLAGQIERFEGKDVGPQAVIPSRFGSSASVTAEAGGKEERKERLITTEQLAQAMRAASGCHLVSGLGCLVSLATGPILP